LLFLHSLLATDLIDSDQTVTTLIARKSAQVTDL